MKIVRIMIFLMIGLSTSLFAGVPLKVLTYNLGLAHTFVPLASERLPHLIAHLIKSKADVLCLQEVWTKSDRKEIVSSLSSLFPSSHSLKIKQKHSKQRPTCKIRNVFGKGKFVNCLQSECKGTSGDEFTTCVINKCRGSLERLKAENSDCAQGILSQVGKTTLQALIAVFNPFRGAGLFSYKGSDGLLILSKHEIVERKTIEMDEISTGSRRRVLLSTLNVEGQKVTVGCTHLTANLARTVPYTGEFSGWAMENMAQVKTLLRKTVKIESPLVLAGDYNCSLNDPERGVMDEFGKSCELFLSAGFDDPFYKENGQCTFCEKNTLVKKNPEGKQDFLLDHIFSRDIDMVSTSLKYDKTVLLKKEGTTKESNLSDHFGIMVEYNL